MTGKIKYQRELLGWQVYPRNWWQLWVCRIWFTADEYGPAEEVVTFSVFQFRFAMWRKEQK